MIWARGNATCNATTVSTIPWIWRRYDGWIRRFGQSYFMAFESQQGAGQVPYYMAAARNAQTQT